ncbi:MAG: hypothetical protein JSV80_13730 [Acidobacteriota bacterium]|nr:MAG: hypothetical protein JSV80_13730 [Acidobacteriota bacterium]
MHAHARHLAKPLVLAGLVAATPSAPAVDLACPNGQNAPCGITYGVSFVTDDGPLGQDERAHYCDAMREAGRKIWVMTEGKHYFDRIEFTWDDYGADAVWRRSQGSIYHDPNTGRVSMRDNFVGCTTRGDAGCVEDQQLWDLPPGDLKCNVETELPNPATGVLTTMKFCSYDGGESYPGDAVPYPAAEKGATMAHEIGHQYYNLDDEYTYPDNPQGWPWSIRVCDNETDGVCVMSRIHRPHMCDNGYDYNAPNQPISWSHVSNTCEPHFTGDPQYCGGEYPNGVTCDEDKATCRWGTIQNAKQHSCWALARSAHADLDTVHEQVGVYLSEAEIGDPPKMADCVWQGEFSADQVLLIDRSGSMNYVGDSAVAAVKEAADAALYFFNHGKQGKENGVLAFNESFEWLKPYQEFDAAQQSSEWDPPYDNGSGGLTAGGNTDICGAIIEMTNVVRSVHPATDYGENEARDTVHAVLFSDGKQTVEYQGTPCYPDVAARLACTPEQDWGYPDPYPPFDPQAPRIKIHSLAYGDADPAALYDVSTECSATVWAAGQTSVPQNIAEPDPHELKMYIARTSTLTRELDELLDTRERVNPGGIESKIFHVPAGSLALDFTWIGSRYWAESDGIHCGFQKLNNFELESPSGIVHTAPAVDPGVNENFHWTKSLRVANPEAGTWAARFDASGLGCPQSHALQVAWLASVDNPSLLGAAWPVPRRARVDTPVRIYARMHFGADLTEIQAKARVYHAGQEWLVTLYDDGQHGDAGVRDGLYAGVFNESAVNMPSGNYAVKVRLKSYSGTALDADTLETGPGTASMQIETFFRLDTAYFPPDEDGMIDHGTIETSFDRLRQGQTYSALEVIVRGIPVIEEEVRLSLGPRVRVDVQRVVFDYPFDAARIVFNAEVLADARIGPRDVRLQVGPSRARGVGVFAIDCAGRLGTTPGQVQDLRLTNARAGLTFDWLPADDAEDGHAIYEGRLDGEFDSLVCTGERTPPEQSSATIVPSSGDRYYLVSGVNEAAGRCGGYREGSIGVSSSGYARRAAREACP